MEQSEKAASVPRPVRDLVLGYLNTSQVMGKLWLWTVAFLAAALPLGFYGAGNDHVEALVNGAGFWIILGILSRLAVFEFRQLRAAWVARRIEGRIRAGTPAREALIRWIAENNDGNYLNTILKKLGVSPRATGIFAAPLRESLGVEVPRMAGLASEMFERLVPSASDSTRTCVYTTTKTQMLNEDGEWVTVDSSTSSCGDLPPEDALRRTLAALEEAGTAAAATGGTGGAPRRDGPIPLSSAEADRPRATRLESGERRRRPDYMPLELDEFDPDDEDEESEEATVGAPESRGEG